MSKLKKYIEFIFKSFSNSLRVATNKIISALVESTRTISYVETFSNKQTHYIELLKTPTRKY